MSTQPPVPTPQAETEPFPGIVVSVPLSFTELHILLMALNAAPFQGVPTILTVGELVKNLDSAQTTIRQLAQAQAQRDVTVDEEQRPPEA